MYPGNRIRVQRAAKCAKTEQEERDALTVATVLALGLPTPGFTFAKVDLEPVTVFT